MKREEILKATQSLSTERLILRPLHVGNLRAMFNILNSHRVGDDIAFFRNDMSEVDAAKWCAQVIEDSQKSNSVFMVGMFTKENPNEMIGYARIADPIRDDDETDKWELGYRMEKTMQGQGYATEAAAALVEFAKDLELKTIFATTTPGNKASENVLRKTGLKFRRVVLQQSSYPKNYFDMSLTS